MSRSAKHVTDGAHARAVLMLILVDRRSLGLKSVARRDCAVTAPR